MGFALEQINGQAILDEKLTGKGVKVGIIDGGFLKADKTESLAHLFEGEHIGGYKDYLEPEAEPFSGSAAFDDVHGTEVWELIAGYSKERNVQYGLATEATYFLARTDHGGYEKRTEEENAIAAMEWMAEEGVKIINLSLGYNFGYTRKSENYTPEQMDGKSTIVTQAVDRISRKYGILFIVAAGNDGSNHWKIVGSPGDAKSALTVGATKLKVWDHMNYSSRGSTWLEYVKPEIASYASLGTSFSAPIITGLAACLLQKQPSMTGEELKALLIKSCDLSHPNNYTGYGVPDAAKALALLEGTEPQKTIIHSDKKTVAIPLGDPSIYVAVYFKNDWRVIKKDIYRTNKTTFKLKRKKDAAHATVIWEGGSVEVVWKN
ncbi:MAG: hypothetical protein Tsb0034_03820 [Ekhidna sp.]